jgi:hypothetical protein
MKLVKTTTLVFAEGRTERVYEIDLCEVGTGQFVVNFRYGKRGTTLKDGTKTALPIAAAEADHVFDRLVEQQKEKGYLPEGATRPAPPHTEARSPAPRAPGASAETSAATPPAAGSSSFAAPKQRDRIIERLAAAAARSVRPPAPSSPPAPTAVPSREPAGQAGVGAEVVSFSSAQGFGIARIESGQTMPFDISVSLIGAQGLTPGLRVRVDIGPSRIPGRLSIRRLWREGTSPDRPVTRPPATPVARTSGDALDRVIWRAGELRIREAEPALLALVGTGNALRDYGVAWALGRLGTAASLHALRRLYENAATPLHVKRVATLALQSLGDETTRRGLTEQLVAALPEGLRSAISGSTPDLIVASLRAYLAAQGPDAWGVVDLLYAADVAAARQAVIAELRTVPLTPPYFYFVRHIFKAAEYRRDAEVLGLLAYRFEKTRANFAGMNYSARHGRGAPMAYGGRTRRYLRRRVWRALRRAGRMGDLDYVKLAVGVLLPFVDADAAAPRESVFASKYGPWAPYWAFNAILYGASPRYEAVPNGKTWRYKRGVRPDAPPPTLREESFPKLWNARPEGLMHLLMESACAPVHEFATKAIRAVPAFLAELDVEDVISLLSRPYEETARLGLELAEARYDRNAPNLALLLGLAGSVYAPARAKAFARLDEQRTRVLADAALVAGLVVAPHADTREFARRLLRSSSVSPEVGAVLVARVVAAMLALADTPDGDARARDATQTLILALTSHLVSVGPDVVRDLLVHPLSGVEELGAELLLRGETRSGALPEDVLVAILHSPHENVRAVGMRLLAQLADDVLASLELLLSRLSTDKNPDLRNASRPLIHRLVKSHPAAAETIARALVEALLRRKLPEGAASHVLRVLGEDLFEVVRGLPTADVWRLLQSGSEHAQELGGRLLQGTSPDKLEMDQIVRLASHDILSVRQASWSFYERGIDRARANVAEAARILDAKWADSRAFAFRFFREHFGAEAFTADVLVTILDSVRDDVQAFGRELTTKYFREEDGPVLMAKLSEHPSVAVEAYTTNYLTRYATDRPGVLEKLVPYFTTTLSRVNKGRVAKQRVLAFLEAEGKKSGEAARVVLAIFHRVSATMAIELRSAAIASMVDIHTAQPDATVALRFNDPPVREARGATL